VVSFLGAEWFAWKPGFRQFGSRVMDLDFVVFFPAGTFGFNLIPTNPTIASTPAKMKRVSRIFMRG
jgi:hypothetical protein